MKAIRSLVSRARVEAIRHDYPTQFNRRVHRALIAGALMAAMAVTAAGWPHLALGF